MKCTECTAVTQWQQILHRTAQPLPSLLTTVLVESLTSEPPHHQSLNSETLWTHLVTELFVILQPRPAQSIAITKHRLGFDVSALFERQVRKLLCLQLGDSNSHRFQSRIPGASKTPQDNNTARVRIWYRFSLWGFEVGSGNPKWDHSGPAGSREGDSVSCGDEKNF